MTNEESIDNISKFIRYFGDLSVDKIVLLFGFVVLIIEGFE